MLERMDMVREGGGFFMVVSKLIQVIFLYVVVRVWNERALLMNASSIHTLCC